MKIRIITRVLFFLISFLIITVFSTRALFTSSASVGMNTFSTAMSFPSPLKNVVINEVFYDVDGDHGIEGKNEWIELYNPNDAEINIKDWTITDNSYTKPINPNVNIPAHGFALLAHDNETWHLWDDPNGINIITINLTGSTNWLSNSGDRIILKDSFGTTLDQMSYGTDTTVFNPSCPDVAEGHSLSRNPLGFDTNVATDFIDLASPTPGS